VKPMRFSNQFGLKDKGVRRVRYSYFPTTRGNLEGAILVEVAICGSVGVGIRSIEPISVQQAARKKLWPSTFFCQPLTGAASRAKTPTAWIDDPPHHLDIGTAHLTAGIKS
jgi:hypothetical protein